MSIVPIGHPWLTQADTKALMSYGQALVEKGLVSACVPGATDDGCPLVALVDATHEDLLFVIGKEYGWYYVIDGDGRVLADSRFLDQASRPCRSTGGLGSASATDRLRLEASTWK